LAKNTLGDHASDLSWTCHGLQKREGSSNRGQILSTDTQLRGGILHRKGEIGGWGEVFLAEKKLTVWRMKTHSVFLPRGKAADGGGRQANAGNKYKERGGTLPREGMPKSLQDGARRLELTSSTRKGNRNGIGKLLKKNLRKRDA